MSSTSTRKASIRIIALDILMMLLLVGNLSLIIFDWLFMAAPVRALLLKNAENFHNFYLTQIHENFFTIDLVFVSVFLSELLIRWGIAIYNHTYHRWFFYPFVHWYDTLGCIPIASFRFLRVLRVISIAYRMQRLSIINLKNTYFYGVLKRYYNILVEEISDRVVVNVLNGFQDELRRDNPVTDKIIRDVIIPRKEILTEWLVSRVRMVAAETYYAHRVEIQTYLNSLIGEAIKNNKEVKAIKQVPVVGGFISKSLEKAVADITLHSVNEAMADLARDKNHAFFHGMAENVVDGLISKEEKSELNSAFKGVLLESLELIKEQVKIQQWKLNTSIEEEIGISEKPNHVTSTAKNFPPNRDEKNL